MRHGKELKNSKWKYSTSNELMKSHGWNIKNKKFGSQVLKQQQVCPADVRRWLLLNRDWLTGTCLVMVGFLLWVTRPTN